MPALTRYTQKIFASNAGTNQLSEYGSFAASPPGNLYDGSTITPTIVQNLSNFESGQYSAVGGSYSPTIQDHNSLFYLSSYQLAYLLQSGIPEWDSGTTYYLNNYVRSGSTLYISVANNNTNNAVTNTSYWVPKFNNVPKVTLLSGSGTYTTSSTNAPLFIRVMMVGGGGGGGGAGGSTAVAGGSDGTDSVFGPFTAEKGIAASVSTNLGRGGLGGSVINAGTATTPTINYTIGGNGEDGTFAVFPSGYSGYQRGGAGGSSFYGSNYTTTNNTALTYPWGAGGFGESILSSGTGSAYSGAGGGAGGYFDGIIENPGTSGTFSYSVGVGGTSGHVSDSLGVGGQGFITVVEFYQ